MCSFAWKLFGILLYYCIIVLLLLYLYIMLYVLQKILVLLYTKETVIIKMISYGSARHMPAT